MNKILITSDISARRVEKKDMKDIHDLSNSRSVREVSFNTGEISKKEHQKWFEEKLQGADFFFILEEDDTFAGSVRFDRKQEGWVISIAIKESFKGKGIGSKAIEVLSKYVKERINGCIFAHIKKDNDISLKSFLKAGYKEFSKSEIIKMIFD